MTLNPAEVLRELGRLVGIGSRLPAEEQAELRAAVENLTAVVGPTVRKSVAARALGISQTALDKWINKQEIATVMTPAGRREVPVREVVAILAEMSLFERDRDNLRPVADAMRRRRERAQISADLLPWYPHGVSDDHERANLRSLAYHRAVARRLDSTLVADARRRLNRWMKDRRIDPYWGEQWAAILDAPLSDIVEVIGADTVEAADLRQSSPFAGALSERERQEILTAVDRTL